MNVIETCHISNFVSPGSNAAVERVFFPNEQHTNELKKKKNSILRKTVDAFLIIENKL